MNDGWKRAGLAVAFCFSVLRACPQQTNTVEAAFQDDPAARHLYQEMIQPV
jgi:hypothetical protein